MIGESAKDPRLDNLQCISPEVWGKAATAQKAAFLFLHQWPVCNLDSLKIKYETCVLFGQIAIEESLRVGPLNTKYGTMLAKGTSLFYCGSLFQCQVFVFDIYHQKSFYYSRLLHRYVLIWSFMKHIIVGHSLLFLCYMTNPATSCWQISRWWEPNHGKVRNN